MMPALRTSLSRYSVALARTRPADPIKLTLPRNGQMIIADDTQVRPTEGGIHEARNDFDVAGHAGSALDR